MRLTSLRSALFLAFSVTVAPFVTAESTARASLTLPSAAQPRLALASADRVFLAYGHGPDVFVARSDDRGATFGPAVKVATAPGLMLGMRRGPRIVAQGDRVTVTFNVRNLLSYSSTDGGRTWTGPVTVNDVAESAQEGLHDLAVAPDGRTFVTWLDIRLGRMALFAAESVDSGLTWSANSLLYRSPDTTICECCHPGATFDADGNLAVSWRNALGGARDLWLVTRPAGATQFGEPTKQGTGSWLLKGCPMDGGGIIARGKNRFDTVWQRDGQIFFQGPTGAELPLARGKQPVAVSLATGTLLVWQQGLDLWSAALTAGQSVVTPELHAKNARFPVLVVLPQNRGTLLAYEQGPAKGAISVVVEHLD